MILGIDPGITGALAWLVDGKVFRVEDIPTMQRGKEGNRQQVNGVVLGDMLRAHPLEHAYLEYVQGAPRRANDRTASAMGAASAFHFGGSFHGLRIALEVLKIPYTLVSPAVWKRRAGLTGAEKDLSRTRALQLYPGASAVLTRKKDGGRAEAILIAHYGDGTKNDGASIAARAAIDAARAAAPATFNLHAPPEAP